MTAAPAPTPELVDRVVMLAERLRARGFEVSTGEVIDATGVVRQLDLLDQPTVRAGLRAALVKQADPQGLFDICFDATFRTVEGPTGPSLTAGATAPGAPSAPTPPAPVTPGAHALDGPLLAALLDGDEATLAALADQAVGWYAGFEGPLGTERYHLHRVLRAIDLSRMLSAAMRAARSQGDLDELELALRRSELTAMLDQLRRRLAAEIAQRLEGLSPPDAAGFAADPGELDLLQLSRTEQEEVRRMLEPLARRLAARIGRRRRRRSTGRLDVRRTVRRSLQTGGVPLDVVTRRRHPHRPEVVVLCDVSGSVAEFAQFTFTLVNALHAELRRVRSFAFVDGIAEVTDVFEQARHEVAVTRLLDRRGVVGLDGHSDYGAAFRQFCVEHLDDAVGTATTVIITGDARGNYRDAGASHLEQIARRARRVYWLNPEPVAEWGEEDSLIEEYRHCCTSVHEVRTLGQLADALADLV